MTVDEPPAATDPGPEQDQVSPRPARGRGPVLALVGLVAVLLVGAAVLVPSLFDEPQPDEPAPTLDEVVVVDKLTNDHVDGEVDYDRQPPVGGPHDGAWHACGVYDEPIRDENAVHSLEHGTVWITHLPDLAEPEVNALAATLPDEGILSPYPGQEAPVVVTVWGRQLALTGPDDPRLRLFLDRYGDGHTSPEPFASCEGGVQEPGGDAVAT